MDISTIIVLIISLLLLLLLIVYAFKPKRFLPPHIRRRWDRIREAFLRNFRPGPKSLFGHIKDVPNDIKEKWAAIKNAILRFIKPKPEPKPPSRLVPKPPPLGPPHPPPPGKKFEIEDVILDDFKENESAYTFDFILKCVNVSNEKFENLYASLEVTNKPVTIKPRYAELELSDKEQQKYVKVKKSDANKWECNPFEIQITKAEEEKDERFYDNLRFALNIEQKIA